MCVTVYLLTNVNTRTYRKYLSNIITPVHIHCAPFDSFYQEKKMWWPPEIVQSLPFPFPPTLPVFGSRALGVGKYTETP